MLEACKKSVCICHGNFYDFCEKVCAFIVVIDLSCPYALHFLCACKNAHQEAMRLPFLYTKTMHQYSFAICMKIGVSMYHHGVQNILTFF
jgi:hypothetical protein